MPQKKTSTPFTENSELYIVLLQDPAHTVMKIKKINIIKKIVNYIPLCSKTSLSPPNFLIQIQQQYLKLEKMSTI